MAPSANLSLDGSRPSMYEPVHGSAFDLVGRGVANPIGMVLSAALMLDDLGLRRERRRACAERWRRACADGIVTPDVGGRATTKEVAEAILHALRD